MSEKTLMELIETRQEVWIAMFDARIRRAEAAELAVEAWLAWCDSDDRDGTWDVFKSHVAEYKSAREAVRKLEETT